MSRGCRPAGWAERIRSRRILRLPVEPRIAGLKSRWVHRGNSPAIVNPIIVVAAARTIGGQPISERRILIASVAYAVPMAAVFVLTGYALGEALRAA